MNALLTQPALSVHDLSVIRGGTSILENVTFQLYPGQVLFVTGDNGAGKTTLIKAVLGIVPIARGRVEVFDTLVGSREWRRTRSTVGYVNQESVTVEFPISAAEVVEVGMALQGGSRKTHHGRALAAMERTGTAGLANRDYRVLSGGEKQRVSIARCLAQNAKIVLLDEPGAFLDPDGRLEVLRTIQTLADSGVAVLLVSHHETAPPKGAWRRVQLERGIAKEISQMEAR